MSKLTELMREHELSTIKYVSERIPADKEVLRQMYPKIEVSDGYRDYNGRHHPATSGEITCKSSCYHTVYPMKDEETGDMYWAYSWPGQNYVVSPKLLPLDVLHDLVKAKEADLKSARKKREESMKTPRDVVRLTFRDLKIKHERIQGHPRIDCGPCEIAFVAGLDKDPTVEVKFIYRDYYKEEITLTKLSVADPNFNHKILAIAHNGSNLAKLILGEMQPMSLKAPEEAA